MDRPTRPTVAEIDLGAIEFNLGGIRKKVGKSVKIMGVVKANAYGHGLVEVSKFLEKRAIDYLGVALPEEGKHLRESGVRKPVHVLSCSSKSQADLLPRYDLEATVSSGTDLEVLEATGKRSRKTIPVHLKIETGMNRIGVKLRDLETVLLQVGKCKRVELKGVFTHFANSDDRDKSFARQQIAEFHKALEITHHICGDPTTIHCANSAAILDLPESYFSMVRCGIMLYGHYPSKETSQSIKLRQAMTVRSRVLHVKRIESGESVSYGRRFVSSRPTTVATVPIGYADGYSRLLTGKSIAMIRGQKHPVVGTICMDQCMVDCGNTDVEVGDEVVLLGRQGGQEITAWDLADRLGTIPYEICCGFSSRVPRMFVNS